jgi:hypothetical protein
MKPAYSRVNAQGPDADVACDILGGVARALGRFGASDGESIEGADLVARCGTRFAAAPNRPLWIRMLRTSEAQGETPSRRDDYSMNAVSSAGATGDGLIERRAVDELETDPTA